MSAVGGKHGELCDDRGRIDDRKQCAITGLLSRIDIARGDHAGDRGRDIVGAQALVAFDDRQYLARADCVTELLVDCLNGARKARCNLTFARRVSGDSSVECPSADERRRTRNLGLNPCGLRDVLSNRRAPFEAVEGPLVRLAGVARHDFHLKRMRLTNNSASSEVVFLRCKGEAIDFAAQPRELHSQAHLIERYGFAVQCRPGVILGRDAAFEDRKLNFEGTIDQHAPAMRAARRLLFGCLFSMSFQAVAIRALARTTGSQHHEDEQERE